MQLTGPKSSDFVPGLLCEAKRLGLTQAHRMFLASRFLGEDVQWQILEERQRSYILDVVLVDLEMGLDPSSASALQTTPRPPPAMPGGSPLGSGTLGSGVIPRVDSGTGLLPTSGFYV